MKQLTSKRTGKIQIVNEETYDNIVARGWKSRYEVTDLPEVRLQKVPEIPPELKRKKKNEQND